MDKRSKKYKENKVMDLSRNGTLITQTFKVKKCLFDSPKSDPDSPKLESPLASNSPKDQEDDSPYALFQIRKKRTAGHKQLSVISDVTPLKRFFVPAASPVDKMDTSSPCIEDRNLIKIAIQKSLTEGNLTGDFSKPCFLPVVKGSHPDLKTITPQTVADLLRRRYDAQCYTIVDCRYPYEFQGGHIKNAVNLFRKDDAEKDFFGSFTKGMVSNRLLIFYCEFSSQRAPSMIRFLRNRDRDLNEYPFLHYPELYLVEGGYKAFHSSFKELCDPQEYQTMLDKSFSQEFVFYRSMCKSWSMKSKRGKKARSALKFESPMPSPMRE